MKFSSVQVLFLSLLVFAACTQNSGEKSTAEAKLTNQKIIEIPKLLDRAEALRNGKEWDDVQNFYAARAAELRKNSNDHEAKIKLAECFIREARVTGEHPHYYPAAMALVKQVTSDLEKTDLSNPRNKDLMFRALSHESSIELSLHHFAEAKITAQKAIELNPYNAYIYGCLVDANVELGDLKTAVEVCDKMVSIRPDLRSYSRVSYLRELHGDLPGAIEAMDMAVKAGYPGTEETEWARLQLGKLYEKKGKLDEAQQQFEMSLAFRPNYPFAMAELANLDIRRGKLAEAETTLKKAIEIIPEVGFYIDLAKIYKQSKRQDELQKLIPEIEQMFADDIAAGHNMSLEAANFHLEVTGDLAKAKKFAQEELAARPENQEIKKLAKAVGLVN